MHSTCIHGINLSLIRQFGFITICANIQQFHKNMTNENNFNKGKKITLAYILGNSRSKRCMLAVYLTALNRVWRLIRWDHLCCPWSILPHSLPRSLKVRLHTCLRFLRLNLWLSLPAFCLFQYFSLSFLSSKMNNLTI